MPNNGQIIALALPILGGHEEFYASEVAGISYHLVELHQPLDCLQNGQSFGATQVY